ncbi:MmgE/PrpD family protein [Bradyrhizobium sp. 183]|uniref:MmgE/PrpD family protein n=1 Tax=Bradyrhizobium sp. 184 TaxID=2782653 RepID=UPI002068796C|nr:MmgE/PrpD family protein [Bradyrhizobium sp. 184]UPJ87051.1 MmgE/PrpD family protein [Bradyrhizobium sp. 183]
MQSRKAHLTNAFAEVLLSTATAALMQAANHRILDALGVTFDGLDEQASQVAFRSVSPCEGPYTMIGRKTTATAADAAFVNAVASSVSAQADCGGGSHTGISVIPVSLALGEQYRCSRRELLGWRFLSGLSWREPGSLAPSDIERVIVTRPAGGWSGVDTPGVRTAPPYRNTSRAQTSAKFTSASALLGKPVTEFRYFRESFDDRDVRAVAGNRKMKLQAFGPSDSESLQSNLAPLQKSTPANRLRGSSRPRLLQAFSGRPPPAVIDHGGFRAAFLVMALLPLATWILDPAAPNRVQKHTLRQFGIVAHESPMATFLS